MIFVGVVLTQSLHGLYIAYEHRMWFTFHYHSKFLWKLSLEHVFILRQVQQILFAFKLGISMEKIKDRKKEKSLGDLSSY